MIAFCRNDLSPKNRSNFLLTPPGIVCNIARFFFFLFLLLLRRISRNEKEEKELRNRGVCVCPAILFPSKAKACGRKVRELRTHKIGKRKEENTSFAGEKSKDETSFVCGKILFQRLTYPKDPKFQKAILAQTSLFMSLKKELHTLFSHTLPKTESGLRHPFVCTFLPPPPPPN